jgi:phage terminase large subunit
MEIKIPNKWNPRKDQMPFWQYMQDNIYNGRAVVCAFRQWGKDTVGMHFLCTAAHQRIGNYWHMLPEATQSRKAIWESINPETGILRIDEAFPESLRSNTKNSEMKIDFKVGSTYQLVGSDNFNSLVGAMPIGILASEWALANPMAWAYLGPMVEKNNGFIIFVSTPRGNNHFKRLLDFAKKETGWYAQLITAFDAEVYTLEKLEKIKKGYVVQFGEEEGEALFNQEYLCSFEGATPGSYYSKLMGIARQEKRITKVPYQPQIEVNTYWDLGVDDSMTIWFIQHIGKVHHVIDYYENSGMGLEHYAKVLKEKGYNYGNHFMPHDANVREMSSGEIAKSRKEVAEGCGISPIIVVERAKNMDVVINVHIPAVRNILPRCWFDEEKCFNGISALEGYHAKYDNEKKVLSKHPDHDINSHGADAFRTFVVGLRPLLKVKTVEEIMRGRIY